MSIDMGQLQRDILTAASGAAATDIGNLAGFSRSQLRKIAKQTEWIRAGRLAGDLDDELFRFHLDDLARLIDSFVKVLAALTIVMMERVWNAIVGVVWRTMETAIGAPIPLPFRP